MAIITAIGTSNPKMKFTQDFLLEKISQRLDISEHDFQKLKRIYNGTKIQTRHSIIEDFADDNCGFFFSDGAFPNIGARMELYKNELPKLAYESIDNCLKQHNTNAQEITHVITCSSTGFYSPGLDIDIIANYKLPIGTGRTCINNMGCCASLNALQVANALADRSPDAKVLLVCIELCTLHFRNKKGWRDLIATSLFGDGAAAVLLSGDKKQKGMKIRNFFTLIHPDNGKEVSWYIKDDGFEVNLSSYVPVLVKNGIPALIKGLFEKGKMTRKEIDFFAIHPGGKKILEVCEKQLGLSLAESAYSSQVLRDYGNMSSPTLLFVLKKIFYESKGKPNEKILALAFGPGLALESMIMNFT